MNDIASVAASSSGSHLVALPTGDLRIQVTRSDFPLGDICAFAARRNPKRGFLFVSKVLGKHIPVRPTVMRGVHSQLASRVSAELPGPVLFIGMAETAITLGHGVYDEYVKRTGRDDTVFVHSTRYRVAQEPAIEFLEEHSHAADHIIYVPFEERAKRLFNDARSVVLVDDEASTGKTFINLARGLKTRFPQVQRFETVMITDWRGAEQTQRCHDAMPAPTNTSSILEGNYSFNAAPNLVAVDMPKVDGNGSHKDGIVKAAYGRLGLVGAAAVTRGVKECLDRNAKYISRLGGDILVLGTGEFGYPPFVLAEQLERDGHSVWYQSTTRSPIMVGNAIETSLTFRDNYEDGIPNFLYNASKGRYRHVVLCHETPDVDQELIAALDAVTLEI